MWNLFLNDSWKRKLVVILQFTFKYKSNTSTVKSFKVDNQSNSTTLSQI